MSWLHEHEWVPVRHVLRCADADCGAWVPLPLSDPEAVVPAELPARRRKPKPPPSASKKSRPRSGSGSGSAGGNVVALSSRKGR